MKTRLIVAILACLLVVGLLAGCVEEGGKEVKIKVIYDGGWSGSYGDLGSTKSVDGSGTKVITIPEAEMIVSATFQKQDGSSKKLTVQIIKGDKVVEEEDTTAAYGVVSVSHTL